MMQRLPFLFSAILFFSSELFSQKDLLPDYIIWEKGDTAFCKIVSIERLSGNICSIDFVNSENKKIELRNSFEVSKVKFISVNNEYFWEYVPLKAKKSNLFRHLEIEVNGNIKVYANKQWVLKQYGNGEKYISDPTAKFGGVSKTIKLNNGKYLDLNKRNLKNEIIPFLLSCPEFKRLFNEQITQKNILEAVKKYNEWCFNQSLH